MVQACIPGAAAELLRRVQASAEGVPLLVEDLLASPGLPESFTETVRERLASFSEPQRAAIEAAAILGRHFDWELLPAVSGQTAALVAQTLGLAVEQLLVSADGTAFRFRHALTREAVLDTMLPPASGTWPRRRSPSWTPRTRAWKAACASWPSSWPTGPGTAAGLGRC